jgi:hypothetical protein
MATDAPATLKDSRPSSISESICADVNWAMPKVEIAGISRQTSNMRRYINFIMNILMIEDKLKLIKNY